MISNNFLSVIIILINVSVQQDYINGSYKFNDKFL